jgi:hypothetical protein
LAGGVALVLVVGASVPYVWVRVPGAVVSIDGKPAAVPVYRSHDGSLLLWMNKPVVLFPSAGAVHPVDIAQPFLDLDWDAHDWGHILLTGGFALVATDHYLPGVLGSYYEGDRHAAVHTGYIEFKEDSQSPRVRVTF